MNIARIARILAAAGIVGVSVSVLAQGIQVSPEPYMERPPLPFAPAAPSGNVPAPPTVNFEVKASDRVLRETLGRWAKDAGWTHTAVHWALDRDHPIEAVADASQFGTDFKTAVRKLLATTENTDRPVQPCFYSNHVLRVIPKAEFCDRATAALQ